LKVLGIDPGLSGALALLDPKTSEVEVWDFPTFVVGKTGRRVIDEVQLANIIDGIAGTGCAFEAWLEQVGPRPGEGAVGAFSFGRSYGLIRGVLAAHFAPVNDVTPQAWKAALKVKGDKDESRRRASQLLPRAAWNWPLKKHDGRAEAALIALFGASKKALVG
jgi:crossover junction endodeoxyribonuclease RuvC